MITFDSQMYTPITIGYDECGDFYIKFHYCDVIVDPQELIDKIQVEMAKQHVQDVQDV